MLRYTAKRIGNDLVIQCHVTDLMGTLISATYKRLTNLDVFPRNNQDELEYWYNESKAKEMYCTR